jgi:ABC-type phosphate transport system substrate-binding protein
MKNKITISVVAGVAISTLSSAALASTTTASTVKLEMLGAEAPNPILEQLSPEMQQTLDAYKAENGQIIPGQFLVSCTKKVCPPPMRHEPGLRSYWELFLDKIGIDSTSSIAAITQSKTDKDFS